MPELSITVNTILSLPSFKNASVLAGAESLDNEVLQVSIADSPITEMDYVVSQKGDFYLSGFYFAKDSLESMYEFFDTLIATKSSGLCLLDEYVRELPDEIVKYCDANHIPVLLVSTDTPYATMIKEIVELIIFDGQNTLLVKKISSLLNGTLDDQHKLLMLKEINPHFQSNVSAVYIIPPAESDQAARTAIIDFFRRRIDSFAMEYEGGLLGLITYNTSSQSEADEKVNYYIRHVSAICPNAVIGVSRHNNRLIHAAAAINQAIAASETGFVNKKENNVIYYNDLGIMKLLHLLSGHHELEDFYHEILDPVTEYDKKNGSQLFETMCEFLEQNRDYRAAAKKLFVHENTVRYRVGKVKEILEEQNTADDFCESFSIALKCRRIADPGIK